MTASSGTGRAARGAIPAAAACLILAGPAYAQTGAVIGTVYDSIMGEPLADAAVVLWETPHRSVSDADGRFRIEDVPPGEYSLVFFHTRLGEVGASVGPRRVVVTADDSVEVALATPSLFTVVTSECLFRDSAPGTGVVAGWVGDAASGMGLPGAQVTLSWDVPGEPWPHQKFARTGPSGWYLICDAPVGTPLTVFGSFLNRQARAREVVARVDAPTEAGLLLQPLDGTRIQGYLHDAESGAPIPDAAVWLRGTTFRGVSDGSGAFRFEDVPPGTYMLVMDHLAYGTKMDTLEVPSGQRISVDMRVDQRPIEIAPLTVSVESNPAVLRRARGGIQITRKDVEKVRQTARDAVDVLQALHIPGVVIKRRTDGSLCVGYAPGQVRMMFRSGCVPMMIFLNDARASNNDLVLQLPPDAIDRMVIYKPVEAGNLFGLGAGNGVLVIYTKGN